MRGIKPQIKSGPQETNDYEAAFIETIVTKLDTVFSSPEEVIIKQDDESEHLYYISQGDCTVNIRDENRIEHVAHKILVEGQHFGEIGVIYKCPRTCTVLSRNYNTLARLGSVQFNEIIGNCPEYLIYLRKYVYSYQGTRKIFIWKALTQIPYMKTVSLKAFHDRFLYKLKKLYLSKDDMLLRVGDDTTSLFIVEYGELEVFTEFEGNKFVIERLPTGSVLNYRVVFTEDRMMVNIRATQGSYILELSEDEFENMDQVDPVFDRKIKFYQNQLFKLN
jgi:F-box and leucine-rich repeat protein 7